MKPELTRQTTEAGDTGVNTHERDAEPPTPFAYGKPPNSLTVAGHSVIPNCSKSFYRAFTKPAGRPNSAKAIETAPLGQIGRGIMPREFTQCKRILKQIAGLFLRLFRLGWPVLCGPLFPGREAIFMSRLSRGIVSLGLGGSLLAAGAILAVGGGVVLAAQAVEEVWVNRPQVNILEGKGSAYPAIATAKKGEKLTVIRREGKWLVVQVNGREGFVFENSIDTREVKGGGGLASLVGSSGTSGLSSAAAAKGLQEKAEQYASSHKMDPKILDEMIRRRHQVTGAQWNQFTKDGRVGPYAAE